MFLVARDPELILGLSTDVKPTMAAGWVFLEIDTGHYYESTGATWSASGASASNEFFFTGIEQLNAPSTFYTALDVAGFSVIRFITIDIENTGSVEIGGITGGESGRLLFIQNATNSTVSIFSQNVYASAADRIITTSGGTIVLGSNGTAILMYDAYESRWRMISSTSLDATLTALAGQNWVANALPIGSGSDTVAQISFAANKFPARASTGDLVAKTITDLALSLLDDASQADMLATLGVVAAAQSDQETATSTTTYVAPGRQQFHPSASKGWASFEMAGTWSTNSSYNVSSITDSGTGIGIINWDVDFADALYVSVWWADFDLTSGSNANPMVNQTGITTGTLSFRTNGSSGTAADFDAVCVVAFGDQ